MTEVIVERTWAEPLSDADIMAMFQATQGCLATHRSEWVMSFLSSDRRQLICHFSGPDAESIRIALRQANSPEGRTWAGTIHDAPCVGDAEISAANVAAFREFEEPANFDEIQALEDAGSGCLATHRVSFVRTLFSTDKKRMICLYKAPDAESVRIAQREANMPVKEVVPVNRLVVPAQ